MTAAEYLRTSYKPACDYIGGMLRPKSMPTLNHVRVQRHVIKLVEALSPACEALPEVTVRVRADRFLVPDVVVGRTGSMGSPYPTDPVLLCIEVMSPEERFAQVVGKCDEYLAWGVPTVWILDPDNRRAWQHTTWPPEEIKSGGSLKAGDISVAVDEIFRVLD